MDPLALLMSIPGIGPYVPYITLAIAIASLVATAMPPPRPGAGALYVTLYNLLHLIALNFGNAKAASAKPPAEASPPGLPPVVVLLLAGLGLAALTGCAPGSGAPVLSSPGAALSSINSWTDADLANAIAIATKAGTVPGQPGAVIVPCLSYIRQQLTDLQKGAAPPSGTVGVFTAFVVADLALDNVSAATSSAAIDLYAEACGPLAIKIMNQGLTIQAQIAALGALLAK